MARQQQGMPIGNVIICKGEGGNDGNDGDGAGASTNKQEEAMGHELPIDIRMSCLLNGWRGRIINIHFVF